MLIYKEFVLVTGYWLLVASYSPFAFGDRGLNIEPIFRIKFFK